MDKGASRGGEVVGVDRAPCRRRIHPPDRPSMANKGGESVTDEFAAQLVQVEKMAGRVVDTDRAVAGVGQKVGNDDGLAAPNPALGGELGRERKGRLLQLVG